MLYAKGFNIAAAWYRPAIYDCHNDMGIITDVRQNIALSPIFIVLLSDFDDSIIEYSFYAVMNKPNIPCPYYVWEFWIE